MGTTTEFKLKVSTAEQIAKRNADFEQMTAEQKRVAVCEDALVMIARQNLIPWSGTYLRVPQFDVDSLADSLAGDVQMCDVLSSLPACKVCAIGAIFISAVLRFDRLDVRLGRDAMQGDNETMCDYLEQDSRIFLSRQLDIIEAAFEKYSSLDVECDRAGSMYRTVACSTDRLALILQNIIANNGTFVVGEPIKAVSQ